MSPAGNPVADAAGVCIDTRSITVDKVLRDLSAL
jgi:hypothetical protein